MGSPPNRDYDDRSNVIDIFRVPQDESDDLFDGFSPAEKYLLALESIYRWTLRRDELNDDQIVLAIKRVAKYALEDV